MQASKIKPKHLYAIKDGDDLHRLYVTEVITVRKDSSGSPHDYKSTVKGFDRDADNFERILHPDKILGPFEDYKELVEKERREKQVAEDLRKANDAIQLKDIKTLYVALGLEVPAKLDDFKLPFRTKYSGGVETTAEGLALLAERLRKK